MNEQTGAAQGKEDNSEPNAGAERRDQNRRGGRNRHRGHSQQGQQHAKSSLNMNELRELAELINQHGFTDFEFENENIRVRLRKELAPQIIQAVAPQQTASYQPTASIQTVPVATSAVQSTQAAETAAPQADEDANLKKITSPIVGTFYHAPSPDAEPFVKVGSSVTPDTIVCIVEAMKLMNEIPAETSGEIVKIYVQNGQPVEYGQPLFAVK